MSKILFTLYMVVIIYIYLNAVSELFFSKKNFNTTVCVFMAKVVAAPFWPILVFSMNGREALFKYFKQDNF